MKIFVLGDGRRFVAFDWCEALIFCDFRHPMRSSEHRRGTILAGGAILIFDLISRSERSAGDVHHVVGPPQK